MKWTATIAAWALVLPGVLSVASAAEGVGRGADRAGNGEPLGLLLPGQFVQIPGPNPILLPGPPGAWDDGVIEAADAFRDGPVYYFYYHGTGQGKGYRLGVATASAPLGPFRKPCAAPILDLGPPGSWDDQSVACAMVVREGPAKYWMWYSGKGTSPAHTKWSVGLASAPHPLGPWKKYERNPMLEDFGYVGGVVKLNGKYYLYSEHPIGSTGPDYGPIALALADSPTGPWTRSAKNPVLKQGPPGAWDDGGFSEAEVFHAGGLFHMFYGGAKIDPERIRTRESIGYAFSSDGVHFQKHPQNPVAPREANPNAAAFAEVHAIYEPPLVFLYHTLRYIEPRTPADQRRFPTVENLGVQVLVLSRPFRLDMPVLHHDALGPKTTTPPVDAPPINLTHIRQVSLKLTCVYGAKAAAGVRLCVLPSDDGLQWRSSDAERLDAEFKPAGRVEQTLPLRLKSKFIKVLEENLDRMEPVTDLDVIAAIGG